MPTYIPAWDSLRAFLTDGGITQHDIRLLLRKKGVYLVDGDKDVSIPWLALGGLGIEDVDFLVSKVRAREERVKQGSNHIPTSDRCQFTEVAAAILDMTLTDTVTTDGLEKVHFKQRPRVVSSPEDGTLFIRYVVRKREYTNTFISYENDYPGEVSIADAGNHVLRVTTKHSCRENKNINRRIISSVEKALLDKGLKPADKVTRYLDFGNFTNAERFVFFSTFVDAIPPFTPKGLHFLGLSPDRSKEVPDELGVIVDEVTRLGLNGECLELGRLWTAEEYHEFLFLFRVDILYKYDNGEVTGEALARFWFPDFSKSRAVGSEFESLCLYAKPTSGKTRDMQKIERDFETMASAIESDNIRRYLGI